MENILTEVKANKLIITVDLKVKGRESKSGKSMLLASTSGFTTVAGTDGVKIGLNVIGPKK